MRENSERIANVHFFLPIAFVKLRFKFSRSLMLLITKQMYDFFLYNKFIEN